MLAREGTNLRVESNTPRDGCGRVNTINIWRAAIACFLIAGATGALYRVGFLSGFPLGLDAGNVRHAHSHLMFFGWAAPAIMALMISRIGRFHRAGHGSAFITVVLGAAVYPAFLLAGYDAVSIFGALLPIASILSGLNILAWYAFGAWYLKSTRGRHRTQALRWWDSALVFLWLSSAGAWTRFVIEVLEIEASVLAEVAVHFFLSLFTEGWLVFAAIGFAWWSVGRGGALKEDGLGGGMWPLRLAALGVPLASLIGSNVGSLAPIWTTLAGVGSLLVAVGLGWSLWSLAGLVLAGKRWEWLPSLGFLALKLGIQFGMTLPAVVTWGERVGLRILYLHIMTLGVMSVALMAAAREAWGEQAAPSPWRFSAAVLLLLFGMLLLTGFGGVEGTASLVLAALTSTLPLVVMFRSRQLH